MFGGTSVEVLIGQLSTSFSLLPSAHRRAQELCESRGGRPGLPVPNSPDGLCGRKETLNFTEKVRVQELCESRGGRPGLPVPNRPFTSVDVKQHRTELNCTEVSASSAFPLA